MAKKIRPRTGNRRNPLLHRAIIDAATKVLAKEGPGHFTIEAVAKLAGCGKPSIYRWWPTKTALMMEVYDQVSTQEMNAPEGKDLATDLAAKLRQTWEIWEKRSFGCVLRMILSEMMLSDEGRKHLREVFYPSRQAKAAVAFQLAIERGEIPPETDIQLLMDLMFGYSLFHLVTGQVDAVQNPDRLGAVIAAIARNF
jgi:AcrR family transcriptional regulator